MPYTVAAALSDGEVNLASFEDAAVARPEIRRKLNLVSCRESDQPGRVKFSQVTVTSKGRVHSWECRDGVDGYHPKISDWGDLARKVDDCLMAGGSNGKASTLFDLRDEWTSRSVRAIVNDLVGEVLR